MFNQDQEKKEKIRKNLKILGFFTLVIQALAWVFLLIKPKKVGDFLAGQKREIKELSSGQESFFEFLKDSKKLIKDIFIPYEGNSYKPKSLRPKTLASYVLLAVFIKLVVVGFLFFTYPSPAKLAAIVSANMINLVNQSRQEAGVQPLQENVNLDKFALVKGEDMILRDYFAHDTPEGKKPWQWINRAEYDYIYAGENLAMDFTSAEVVHDAFMKSPSHQRNILNPKYKEIGIAVLQGKLADHQTILLVEFFGTQRKDLLTLNQETESVKEQTAGVNPPNLNNNPAQNTGVAGEELNLVNQQVEGPRPEANNESVIVVTTEDKSKVLVDLIIEYSNIFFVAFLIFMIISLALNIFIKIKVQHASVILQSVVVIALLLAMILVKFHFVEQVAPQLLIL